MRFQNKQGRLSLARRMGKGFFIWDIGPLREARRRVCRARLFKLRLHHQVKAETASRTRDVLEQRRPPHLSIPSRLALRQTQALQGPT
jgi:hypothetical protein